MSFVFVELNSSLPGEAESVVRWLSSGTASTVQAKALACLHERGLPALVLRCWLLNIMCL